MTSLQEYLELTNSKRIKRTADEIERGLDAEGAAKERLIAFEEIEKSAKSAPDATKTPKRTRKKRLGSKGKFTINCKPEAGVNPAFLDALSGAEFNLVINENFYSWFETKLEEPYRGNAKLLIEHILDMGMGEVIISLRSPEELEEHIRLMDYTTILKN
jgi:hypothetical protein